MPQEVWTKKEERQYEHIKAGQQKEGRSAVEAEEIAARTVNKQRAQAGKTKQHSPSSTRDVSAYRRGGKQSGSGPRGRTRDQLYNEARQKGIAGRSKMNKAELEKAVGR